MSALIRALFTSRDGLSRVLTVPNPPPPTFMLPLKPRAGLADMPHHPSARLYIWMKTENETALFEED